MATATRTNSSPMPRATLRPRSRSIRRSAGRAWADFIETFVVRQATGVPESETDLAEGYRWVTRLSRLALDWIVEGSDPLHPQIFLLQDEYKKLFCKDDEPIFDCFIPLSLRGRVTATAMSGINRAKHLVKHTPALFQMAQRLRSAFR